MPTPHRKRSARDLRRSVPVFAALGDHTRLQLLARLGEEAPLSISRLTTGSGLTRQAITKHLRVLQRAGLVRSIHQGRESRFVLRRQALDVPRRALDNIADQWRDALLRLKSFVEEGE